MNEEQITNTFNSLKTVKKELINEYQSNFIGIRNYKVYLNNGDINEVSQITKEGGNGDAVYILAITNNAKFLMVIESRPNTEETVTLSFPAGMIKKGETPEAAAQRELFEETGYQAQSLKKLEWHYQDIGCSKAIIHTFLATNLIKSGSIHLDQNESLNPIEMDPNIIFSWLNANKINDASTKIALMSYVWARNKK